MDGGAAAAKPWRATKAGVVVAVRLTPKSSKDAIEGVETGAEGCYLKARVRALPSEGEANAALTILIAKWLGVPKASVALSGGGKSRLKRVEIAGDGAGLGALIEARLAGVGMGDG